MRSILTTLFLFLLLSPASGGEYSSLWKQVREKNVATKGTQILHPSVYTLFFLNDPAMKDMLSGLSTDPEHAQLLQLPTPDGSFRSFRVWETPVMAKELALKYPGIKTFTAMAADDPHVTAKLDYTKFGFHAMVLDGSNSYFIDPYSDVNDGYYLCYYKKDYRRSSGNYMICEEGSGMTGIVKEEALSTDGSLPGLMMKLNGTQRKKYRLALACTGEYSVAVDGQNPTKAGVLAKMILSVNRVNGVYEKELAVTLELIGNTDTLIFLDSGSDPYSNTSSDLNANQTTVTNRIGSANYDIGHLFGTGGGGIAQAGVCNNNNKARGLTGSANPQGDPFDIDYVAHEMGHQFSAAHTFNSTGSNTGSCNGNRSSSSAYEPGSGTTIMAYAGICGNENMQQHSDPYFHARSLFQISNYITTGTASNCPAVTSSGNTPSTVPPIHAVYNIPKLTPFELTAPTATDANYDSLRYCWEEWDLSNSETTWSQASALAPLFRSFYPSPSPIRVFPTINRLLLGQTDYKGERLPPVARTLRFRLTVRDVYNGFGCFNYSDDTLVLLVAGNGPFTVTSPTSANWVGGSTQTITWDVAGTDQPPVNCSHVDITMSTDGGYTWPYVIASQIPNNGSATVVIPNANTSNTTRIKVKGHNNVFFNINTANINFTHNDTLGSPTGVPHAAGTLNDVHIYPVPAKDVLYISNPSGSDLGVTLYNALGQPVWTGRTNSRSEIPVGSLPGGIYHVHIKDMERGDHLSRSVIKE